MKKYDKISIFRVLASNKLQPRVRHKLVRQTSFVWTTTFVCFTLNQITPIQRKRTEITYSWDGRCSISRNNKTHFSNWHESFFVRKMNYKEEKIGQKVLIISNWIRWKCNLLLRVPTLIDFWYHCEVHGPSSFYVM